MKTRRLRKKVRKTRRRLKRGGGESCYGNGRTWSCSAACGEKGACEKLD